MHEARPLAFPSHTQALNALNTLSRRGAKTGGNLTNVKAVYKWLILQVYSRCDVLSQHAAADWWLSPWKQEYSHVDPSGNNTSFIKNNSPHETCKIKTSDLHFELLSSRAENLPQVFAVMVCNSKKLISCLQTDALSLRGRTIFKIINMNHTFELFSSI
jgi:hypothetical protein